MSCTFKTALKHTSPLPPLPKLCKIIFSLEKSELKELFQLCCSPLRDSEVEEQQSVSHSWKDSGGQNYRLSICWYFGRVCQILRRLWQSQKPIQITIWWWDKQACLDDGAVGYVKIFPLYPFGTVEVLSWEMGEADLMVIVMSIFWCAIIFLFSLGSIRPLTTGPQRWFGPLRPLWSLLGSFINLAKV